MIDYGHGRNKWHEVIGGGSYQRLLFDWIIDHPKFGKSGYDRPLEIEIEMEALRNVLEDYYPGRYSFNRETTNDKFVEDDDENKEEDH